MSTDNPYASPSAERAAPIEVPHLEPPQSVSYQLTEEEALQMSEYIQSINQTYQRYVAKGGRRLLVMAAIVAFLATYIAIVDSITNPICMMLGIASATIFIIATLNRFRIKRINRKLAKEVLARDGGYLLDRKYHATLLGDGFQMSDEDGHTFRKWKSVARVVRLERLLLIFPASLTAFAIPGRAFYDEAGFEGYVALAKQLWSAAHVEPVSESGEVNV
jgi:hypothetical protein